MSATISLYTINEEIFQHIDFWEIDNSFGGNKRQVLQYLLDKQTHQVEKFSIEGIPTLSVDECMNIISYYVIYFDAISEIRAYFKFSSIKKVQETARYFQESEWYQEELRAAIERDFYIEDDENARKLDSDGKKYILECVKQIENLFISASEKNLAIILCDNAFS